MKVSRFRAETLMIDGLAPIAYFGIRVRIMKRRVRMVVVKVVVVCIFEVLSFLILLLLQSLPGAS